MKNGRVLRGKIEPFENMKVDFSKKIINGYSALSRKVVQYHFLDLGF
jgi:hypothetical protein